GAGAVVALVMAAMWLGRQQLSGQSDSNKRHAQTEAIQQAAKAPQVPVGVMLRTLMVQPALWSAFLFFACTSIAWSGVQQYTIPLFSGAYGLNEVTASAALSGYMLLSALGMLLGGFMVSASARNDVILAVSLVVAGILLIVLAMGTFHPSFAMLLLVMSGFAS